MKRTCHVAFHLLSTRARHASTASRLNLSFETNAEQTDRLRVALNEFVTSFCKLIHNQWETLMTRNRLLHMYVYTFVDVCMTTVRVS